MLEESIFLQKMALAQKNGQCQDERDLDPNNTKFGYNPNHSLLACCCQFSSCEICSTSIL